MVTIIFVIIGLIILSVLFGVAVSDDKERRGGTIIFFTILILFQAFLLWASIQFYKNDALRDYDEGKIERVVKYDCVEQDGEMVPVDSTITYKKIK